MRVLIAIKKDIFKKVIIENCTDLVSYSYYMIFDIRERSAASRKYSKKTRIVNLYDNKNDNRYVWQGSSSII